MISVSSASSAPCTTITPAKVGSRKSEVGSRESAEDLRSRSREEPVTPSPSWWCPHVGRCVMAPVERIRVALAHAVPYPALHGRTDRAPGPWADGNRHIGMGSRDAAGGAALATG